MYFQTVQENGRYLYKNDFTLIIESVMRASAHGEVSRIKGSLFFYAFFALWVSHLK